MASRFMKFSELQFDSFVQASMNERRLRDASTFRRDAVKQALIERGFSSDGLSQFQ